MSTPVTISLDEATLRRARIAASARGLTVEEFLADLIKQLHPPLPEERKRLLSNIIGMGSSEEPTDIAKDKDRFLAEAVWKEHLRKTKQE